MKLGPSSAPHLTSSRRKVSLFHAHHLSFESFQDFIRKGRDLGEDGSGGWELGHFHISRIHSSATYKRDISRHICGTRRLQIYCKGKLMERKKKKKTEKVFERIRVVLLKNSQLLPTFLSLSPTEEPPLFRSGFDHGEDPNMPNTKMKCISKWNGMDEMN